MGGGRACGNEKLEPDHSIFNLGTLHLRTHPLLFVGSDFQDEATDKDGGGNSVGPSQAGAASQVADVAGRSDHHQQPGLVEADEEKVKELQRTMKIN